MTHLPKSWLNRTVLGAGLTSLLADLSYESAFAVLPAFLKGIGGSTAQLGLMEGAADALASFVKLGSGAWSDRVARRKPFAVAGYALTGIMPAVMALATAWPLVFVARLVGWFGKGLRGPARDALLAASVSQADRGKAFGLHRSADTVGAILGPLLAIAALGWIDPATVLPERTVLWLCVIPGVGAALAFALLVNEARGAAVKRYTFGDAVRRLPREYRRFLVAVGVFGAGDFSHVLLIAAAGAALAPAYGPLAAAQWAAGFYALRNLAAACAAFPAGALSDRVGRRPLLAAGYLLGAAVMLGFGHLAYHGVTSPAAWATLFALAGVFIATEEALESATAADLVADPQLRGTAFGVLGVVNGVGDFVSSAAVGALLAVAPAAGFVAAAGMMFLGAVLLAWGLGKAN